MVQHLAQCCRHHSERVDRVRPGLLDWLRCSQSCPLQVVNGYTLSSVTAGWAAIGTSVQSNNVYTYAQFDNFQVYGNRLQCPTPFAGNQLSTNVWCGGESHWRVCWRC
jgi:hypothetical protein